MVKKHHDLPRLKIQGVPIDYVFQYKYLGVSIDKILSFWAHLNNTIKIVGHKISLLNKIRFYITEDAAIKIYKTMILPYLDYGYIFFINSNSKAYIPPERQIPGVGGWRWVIPRRQTFALEIPTCWYLKPIFHQNTKYLASGVGVGQCSRRQNFALPNAKYTNMLVSLALDDANFSRRPCTFLFFCVYFIRVG